MNNIALPPLWSRLTATAIVDILIVAILIYQVLMIVRGRRAAHILMGITFLVCLYGVAVFVHLDLLRTVLAYLAPYTAFGAIVMFQSEIRSLLAQLGRRRIFGFRSRLQNREFIDQILLAITQLQREHTGALIVIERNIGLRTFIESGVALDAYLSRDLLLAIFEKNAALHDGAVIIQGDRVAAAGCFLPLTTNPMLPGEFGTRHRAAIGVTEETDCLSLVVSEETGNASVCAFGSIQVNLTLAQVEERLLNHFLRGRERQSAASSPARVPLSSAEDIGNP